ncbi:putative RNA-binding protein 25 [Cocos nucifera]|uniref:Putative RNA-binding protein 25 n=1 Tax=Cocos nucifera TaxID=13894 RepID=A0A8K0MX60_COCNU|nr:putative RNA-binding protein 25 [Cocos nucifera]
MELDEHDYREKSVESAEIRKEKERRSSRHGGDNEKDGGGEERASRQSRAEEQQNGEKVDREERDREKDRHRSSRKAEREHGKDRDHRSRERDQRERDKGKEKERPRDKKRDRENERDREKDRERRREREREREKESERERECEWRSSSRSRRHDREVETEMERARSRERALRERELKGDMRERESKRFKEKKKVVEPEADPERDQRTGIDSQVRDVHLMMDRNSQHSKEVGVGNIMSRGKQIGSSFDRSQLLEMEPIEMEFYKMTHTRQDDSFVRNESRDIMERSTSLSPEHISVSSSSSDGTHVKAQIFAALRGHKVEVAPSQSSVMSKYNRDAKQSSTTEEICRLKAEIENVRQSYITEILSLRRMYETDIHGLRAQLDEIISLLRRFTPP